MKNTANNIEEGTKKMNTQNRNCPPTFAEADAIAQLNQLFPDAVRSLDAVPFRKGDRVVAVRGAGPNNHSAWPKNGAPMFISGESAPIRSNGECLWEISWIDWEMTAAGIAGERDLSKAYRKRKRTTVVWEHEIALWEPTPIKHDLSLRSEETH